MRGSILLLLVLLLSVSGSSSSGSIDDNDNICTAMKNFVCSHQGTCCLKNTDNTPQKRLVAQGVCRHGACHPGENVPNDDDILVNKRNNQALSCIPPCPTGYDNKKYTMISGEQQLPDIRSPTADTFEEVLMFAARAMNDRGVECRNYASLKGVLKQLLQHHQLDVHNVKRDNGDVIGAFRFEVRKPNGHFSDAYVKFGTDTATTGCDEAQVVGQRAGFDSTLYSIPGKAYEAETNGELWVGRDDLQLGGHFKQWRLIGVERVVPLWRVGEWLESYDLDKWSKIRRVRESKLQSVFFHSLPAVGNNTVI